MLIYLEFITPRFKYISDFAGKMIGRSVELTTNPEEFRSSKQPKINYSDQRTGEHEVWIRPHGLLKEQGVRDQQIECSVYENRKIFFTTGGDWPFDIFAASFFLITRYEEYLPHIKDIYGRYAYENSIAFKEDFLQLPLVNQWWNDLRIFFKNRYPSHDFLSPGFNYLPTYDIDIAWSYRNKGIGRTTGALIQALLKGNMQHIWKRVAVLKRKEPDPYDSYNWIHQLHAKYLVKPYYFFLVAEERGIYDKNISPHIPALRDLIMDHFNRYPVGIHPSWISGDQPDLLKKEMRIFTEITGADCVASRQHYIRFCLPVTFRDLIAAGIRYDFSMGYGSINGFRASVATPYYWYDLLNEEATSLMLFPFSYMEANSFYEQKFTPEQALEEMREYRRIIKSTGGTLVTIWHNHFLGTDKLYEGWRNIYEKFMSETAEKI